MFHDETSAAGPDNLLGHILFFIPLVYEFQENNTLFGTYSFRSVPLLSLMQQIRQHRSAHGLEQHKFHFTDLSGKRWSKYGQCYRDVLASTVDAMRRKRSEIFPTPLHCRISVLYYPRNSDLSKYGGTDKKERKLRHYETILRILLKGAMKFLYQDTHLVIENIISDGFPHHREMNKERIIDRLNVDGQINNRAMMPSTVSFSDGASIIHLKSDHKLHSTDSDAAINANMLQVADLLLGAIGESCLKGIGTSHLSPSIGDAVNSMKSLAAWPVHEMIIKRDDRKSGFQSSGHFRSFSISQIEFPRGERPIFKSLCAKVIESPNRDNQIDLSLD